MHKFLFAVITCIIAVNCMAQERLDLGGVADFVASSAKVARGGTSANLDGRVEGILYLPIRSVHAKGDPAVVYAHIGGGGAVYRDGTKLKGEPLVVGLLNITSIASRLTRNWGWYQAHIQETSLPSIFLGPQLKLPMPGITWTWKNASGLAASIGFGGSK